MTDILSLALQAGFSQAAPLDMSALTALEEVRAMCAADRCRAYGRTWSCPPGCGTLEENQARMRSYSNGILVQTTGSMEDDFDVEDCFEILKSTAQEVCPTVVSMVFDVEENTVYWCENRNWEQIQKAVME